MPLRTYVCMYVRELASSNKISRTWAVLIWALEGGGGGEEERETGFEQEKHEGEWL